MNKHSETLDERAPDAVTIRRAGPEDADTLLELVTALAHYEHLEPPDAAARARLVEHGFGPRPRFETFLAEIDSAAIGYALVFETYSTFLARPTLYLEDLFVRPEARRRGAGTALLRFLAAEAVKRGCGRMEWAVLDWNELAQGVYRKLGAQQLDEWRLCRLTGAALQRLAASSEEVKR
jgi:GNAT superfamily N-acetyltransferase